MQEEIGRYDPTEKELISDAQHRHGKRPSNEY
jgi:hypothetical protein